MLWHGGIAKLQKITSVGALRKRQDSTLARAESSYLCLQQWAVVQ